MQIKQEVASTRRQTADRPYVDSGVGYDRLSCGGVAGLLGSIAGGTGAGAMTMAASEDGLLLLCGY